MPLDDKLPDRLLETYIKCIEAKEVLYYPSEVTKEDNELRVGSFKMYTDCTIIHAEHSSLLKL
jgi:hypothetical protein